MKTETILIAAAAFGAGYLLAQSQTTEAPAVGRDRRRKYLQVSAYTRRYPNIGAPQYGNCQCANGTMCVGQGDCSCCDKGAGKITHVITARPLATRQLSSAGKSVSMIGMI